MQFQIQIGTVNATVLEGKDRVVDKLLRILDPQSERDISKKLKLWDGLIHFYDRETRQFPAGLAHRLIRRLTKRGHDVEAVYYPPIPPTTPVPADYLIGANMDGDRQYQLDGVNAGLVAGRGIWWMATNAGKSYMIAAFVGAMKRQLNFSSLVIVPNKTLIHQTSEDVRRLLGPDVRVGVAGDGIKDVECDVLVGTYQTLAQGLPTSGHAHMGIRAFIAKAGCVIVDEGHHAVSATIKAILQAATRAVFRIGCTGTVDGSDKSVARQHASNLKSIEERWRLECYLGPVISRVRNEDLIEKGISAKPIVVTIEDRRAFGPVVHTPKPALDENGKPIRGRGESPYLKVFVKAAIKDKRFRRSVAKVAAALLEQERPPFVFSHSVDQLRRLAKTFDHFEIPYRLVVGKDSTAARKRALQDYAKQGGFALLCSSIFDEGVSLPAIKSLILAGARKKPRELLQRIGRGLRRKGDTENTVVVVDFSMMHSKLLLRHFQARFAEYESEGFEIRRVGDINQFNSLVF